MINCLTNPPLIRQPYTIHRVINIYIEFVEDLSSLYGFGKASVFNWNYVMRRMVRWPWVTGFFEISRQPPTMAGESAAKAEPTIPILKCIFYPL